MGTVQWTTSSQIIRCTSLQSGPVAWQNAIRSSSVTNGKRYSFMVINFHPFQYDLGFVQALIARAAHLKVCGLVHPIRPSWTIYRLIANNMDPWRAWYCRELWKASLEYYGFFFLYKLSILIKSIILPIAMAPVNKIVFRAIIFTISNLALCPWNCRDKSLPNQ